MEESNHTWGLGRGLPKLLWCSCGTTEDCSMNYSFKTQCPLSCHTFLLVSQASGTHTYTQEELYTHTWLFFSLCISFSLFIDKSAAIALVLLSREIAWSGSSWPLQVHASHKHTQDSIAHKANIPSCCSCKKALAALYRALAEGKGSVLALCRHHHSSNLALVYII